MTKLFLDLSKNATRQYLYQEVLNKLSAQDRAQVEQMVLDLPIPNKHHHNVASIYNTIDSLPVSDQVKNDARSIYDILAHAEAEVHGCSIEQTHFHEVGNAEAIQNTLGICVAIEAIHPKKITATCVQTGKGTINCAHGVLDIPAPATSAILKRGIPLCEEKIAGELCTPTSAAIIAHFVDEFSSL